jgi:drug/metabolite transporter (DMT)-like permease
VKTAVVLLLAMLAQAGGDVCLSKGMRHIGAASQLEGHEMVSLILGGLANPTIWLGMGLLGVFFGLYAAALSWADLSFVLPATAFGYILNVACGYYFLHEAVTPARWAGSLLICLGVFCVSRSEIRATLADRTPGDQ